MPWTRFEALLKDTKTLAQAPEWLFQTSTQAGWKFCMEDLMAWYGQCQLLVKYLNLFGILHICRLYCFAIQFHSDGKCRNLPTLHGVKTTYLLVSVA